MRRLYLLIYLAFLGTLAAALAASVVIGWLFIDAQIDRPRFRAAADLIFEHLPAEPGARAAALDRAGERLEAELTLFDAAGAALASTPGARLPAPDVAGPPTQWRHTIDALTVTFRLSDGRWLAVRFAGGGGHERLHHTLALLSLALLIALLCLPLARRITRRLEQLRRGVEGFGAGQLGTRVAVVGRDEVAALAREFNGAADRIEALVGGQRRMLASASHELRSPLARLRLAVELLADAAPHQRALASEAGRDIEELDALVGDLLLTSRLEARPPAQERVDLARLLAEETARAADMSPGTGPAGGSDMSPGAGAAGRSDMSSGAGEAGDSDMSAGTGAASGTPAETVVVGDAAALRRLLRNLLENARRHGRPPVEARVEVAGAALRVVVEDRGPGVPAAERERIFEPFYRPAGHREGDGGVGLGLALVRQIAGCHGGTARCEAREGGGSRFVVELPRASQA